MGSIYDFPDIYDLVIQRRPEVIIAEVQAIQTLLERFGITSGHILELGCGACVHGIPLAQRGYAVTGVDSSSAMLAEAQKRATASDVKVTLVQGDVADFTVEARTFDAAIFLFETFPLLISYDEIVSHFNAVRRHLRQGGIYLLDLDRCRHGIRNKAGEWGHRILALEGGSVETWFEDLPGDWVEATNRLVLHCRITRDGSHYTTRDEWPIRIHYPWNFAVLMRTIPGWHLHGFLSWQDLRANIADEDHYLAVLGVHFDA